MEVSLKNERAPECGASIKLNGFMAKLGNGLNGQALLYLSALGRVNKYLCTLSQDGRVKEEIGHQLEKLMPDRIA